MANATDQSPYGDEHGPEGGARRVGTPYQPEGRGTSLPAIYDLTSRGLPFNGNTWAENLTLHAGACYLVGGAWGAAVGLRRAAAESQRGEPAKLRASRALTRCSAVGRAYGSRLGIIGLLFGGVKSAASGLRGVDDWKNSVAAAMGAGLLYCAPAGPRSAVCGCVVGGLTAGATLVAFRTLKI